MNTREMTRHPFRVQQIFVSRYKMICQITGISPKELSAWLLINEPRHWEAGLTLRNKRDCLPANARAIGNGRQACLTGVSQVDSTNNFRIAFSLQNLSLTNKMDQAFN